MAEDEKAGVARDHDVGASMAVALAGTPGLRAVAEHGGVNRASSRAVIAFTPEWAGPTGQAMQVALAKGEPGIDVQQGGHFDVVAIDPISPRPGDDAVIVRRLPSSSVACRRNRGASPGPRRRRPGCQRRSV